MLARAHQHRAHGDGPDDVVPDRVRRHVPLRISSRPQTPRQIGIEKQQQRDEHPPRQHAAGKVNGRQLRADDVADPHKRRRKIRSGPVNSAVVHDVANRLPAKIEVVDHRARKRKKALAVFAKNLQAFVAFQNLKQAAKGHGAKNIFRRIAALLAGFDDFRAGHTLRKRQVRIHAQRPPQHDDEQHADQPAHQQDHGGFPVVMAQVGPQAHAVDLHQHERRNREDGGGDQRLTHGCRGAHNVLLEHRAAERRQTKERDGNHRRWYGGGDSLPGLHAEIGVGRAEDQRQQQSKTHGFERHLRRRSRFRHSLR